MKKTFNPDINGFTANAVKEIQGTDGCVIRCNLLFNGRKVGEFFDPSNGRPYSFKASVGFRSSAIESTVASFPDLKTAFGSGAECTAVRWDIGILVEELIRLKDMSNALAKAADRTMDLVTVDSLERNAEWMVQIPRSMTDGEAAMEISMIMERMKIQNYEWKRYTESVDLCISNTQVTEDMLR